VREREGGRMVGRNEGHCGDGIGYCAVEETAAVGTSRYAACDRLVKKDGKRGKGKVVEREEGAEGAKREGGLDRDCRRG